MENCFTILCWSLLYNRVNLSCMYVPFLPPPLQVITEHQARLLCYWSVSAPRSPTCFWASTSQMCQAAWGCPAALYIVPVFCLQFWIVSVAVPSIICSNFAVNLMWCILSAEVWYCSFVFISFMSVFNMLFLFSTFFFLHCFHNIYNRKSK